LVQWSPESKKLSGPRQEKKKSLDSPFICPKDIMNSHNKEKKLRKGDLIKWLGLGDRRFGLVVRERREKDERLDKVLVYWLGYHASKWHNEILLRNVVKCSKTTN